MTPRGEHTGSRRGETLAHSVLGACFCFLFRFLFCFVLPPWLFFARGGVVCQKLNGAEATSNKPPTHPPIHQRGGDRPTPLFCVPVFDTRMYNVAVYGCQSFWIARVVDKTCFNEADDTGRQTAATAAACQDKR